MRPHNYKVWGTTFTYYLYHDEKVCIPFYNTHGYKIRATRGYAEIKSFDAINWKNVKVGMCMGMTSNLDLAAAYRNGQIAIPWDNPTYYSTNGWYVTNGGFWNAAPFNIPAKGKHYMVLHSYTPGQAIHRKYRTILLNTSSYGNNGNTGYVYQTKPYCAASKMDDCYTDCNYRSMYGVYIDYVVDAYYVKTCGNTTIYVGQSHTPSATAYASDNATTLSRSMSYSYGNKSVYNGGKGLSAGTCKVTASCSNTSGAPNSTVSNSYTVTVKNRGISISKENEMFEGHRVWVDVSTTPAGDDYTVTCKYGTISGKSKSGFYYRANKVYGSSSNLTETIKVSNAVQTSITASTSFTIKPRKLTLTGSKNRVTPGGEISLTASVAGGNIDGDIIQMRVYKWSDATNKYECYYYKGKEVYDERPAVKTWELKEFTGKKGNTLTTFRCTEEIGKYRVNVDVSGKGYMCNCSGGTTDGVPCNSHFRTNTFLYEVYGASTDPVITAPLLGTTDKSMHHVYMSQPVIMADIGETIGCYVGFRLNITLNGYDENNVPTGENVSDSIVCSYAKIDWGNSTPYEYHLPVLNNNHWDLTDGTLVFRIGTNGLLRNKRSHHWKISLLLSKQIEDVVGITKPKSVEGSFMFYPTTQWFNGKETSPGYIPWYSMFPTTPGTDIQINHNLIGTSSSTFRKGGEICADDANAILEKVFSTLAAYGDYNMYIGNYVTRGEIISMDTLLLPLQGLHSLMHTFDTIVGVQRVYTLRCLTIAITSPGSTAIMMPDNIGSMAYFDDVESYSEQTGPVYKPAYPDIPDEDLPDTCLTTRQRTCSPLMEMIRGLYIL